MIETDQQRRWWFATHPEYSHRSDKQEDGPKRIMLAAAYSPEEAARRPMIGGGGSGVAGPGIRPFSSGGGSSSAPPVRPPVAPVRPPGPPPRTPASSEGGPGKWVEVRRGKYGLEHQSKMSGQPIRESGGKYYIQEYEVNGVKFDDYRDGVLYEYKGNYSNFILRKVSEFYQWFKGAKSARDQAIRQSDAARGVPVKWRVGPANQVKAFKKAVGKVPGVSIEP